MPRDCLIKNIDRPIDAGGNDKIIESRPIDAGIRDRLLSEWPIDARCGHSY